MVCPTHDGSRIFYRFILFITAVEQQLIAQGKPINEETLTQVIGFQDRHYVEDYLAGIKRYEFDEETKRIRPGK